MPVSYKEALAEVGATVNRGKGTFIASLGPDNHAKPFALSVGAPTSVRIPGGRVVSVSLSREQARFLRDQLDELLDKDAS